MNVRKFTASTSRGAWSLVREALGPDAVILSNRTVDGGVEILALAGEDMASLSDPVIEKTISENTLAALAPRHKAAQPAPLAITAGATQAAPAGEINSAELHDVMKEIRSMRGMLEMQLAELAWTDQHKREPAKSSVLREMLAAGFSASLARYLIERMPAGSDNQSGMDWIKTILTRNLATIGNENEILEKGGVYALVGPTGVGKTTTTAKLAARCVMRHGPGKLALITTDGYRIGGYEQLRIYGKILGVMVHSVKDEADLRIALDELKGKHTVLIDTVGVSQRDQMVAEQIAMLSGAGSQVKRLLCLNATSTGETLNEVVRSYMGEGLAGCILTKLDEAATIGSALDVVIRHKLNLYYVANGQRVPEDLHVANQQYLVDRAFKLKRETAPFQFNDAEIPLVMANTARAMNEKSLREVILG
ncbi:flagellar biosynthesis protein FlhF [Herminiimonas sp.]|uniref:flagellar biosynthesis protein FlhF n=1 Tax=Herminiimonas sp. TaxID=1926289 RepID=UPI0027289BCE|nr:flagellar biosynthesis protein FlhF [Herminiimonas sp.]MDO8306019.1 flagellar biosynthesis protein FlhF [Herminiimonas sp.]